MFYIYRHRVSSHRVQSSTERAFSRQLLRRYRSPARYVTIAQWLTIMSGLLMIEDPKQAPQRRFRTGSSSSYYSERAPLVHTIPKFSIQTPLRSSYRSAKTFFILFRSSYYSTIRAIPELATHVLSAARTNPQFTTSGPILARTILKLSIHVIFPTSYCSEFSVIRARVRVSFRTPLATSAN